MKLEEEFAGWMG